MVGLMVNDFFDTFFVSFFQPEDSGDTQNIEGPGEANVDMPGVNGLGKYHRSQ